MNLLIMVSSFRDSNAVQDLADSLRPGGGAGHRSLVISLPASQANSSPGTSGQALQGLAVPSAQLLWRRAWKTSVARSNPRRGTPHDRRISHLYLAARLGRDRRGTLRAG